MGSHLLCLYSLSAAELNLSRSQSVLVANYLPTYCKPYSRDGCFACPSSSAFWLWDVFATTEEVVRTSGLQCLKSMYQQTSWGKLRFC